MAVFEELNTLSIMHRTLNKETLDALRGPAGSYVLRLAAMAEKTFQRGNLVGGTTSFNTGVLAVGRRNRIREVTFEGGIYKRYLNTETGPVIALPLHTVLVTRLGRLVVDPAIKDSYTLAHLPHDQDKFSEPSEMITDLVFTVDRDDLVTVNGQNPVTAKEYLLFNSLVEAFEVAATPQLTEAGTTA